MTGGFLANKLGGKRVIMFVLSSASLINALVPWVAQVHVYFLVALRIIDGMGQGSSNPSVYVLIGKWTSPDERSTMLSIVYTGSSVGFILSSFLSSWICSTDTVGGWPTLFYLYSILGAILTIAWGTNIHENPHQSDGVSDEEIEHFESPASHKENISSIPWFDIITSWAVWANVIAYFTYVFGYLVIIIETPTYLSTVLQVSVKHVGIFMSIICFVQIIIGLLAGVSADYIIQSKYLSVQNTRKLFMFLSLGITSGCFVGQYYVGHNVFAVEVLFAVGFGACGFQFGGTLVNVMDIAERYSGIIIGFMYTISSIGGFFSTIIVGRLTNNQNTHKQWSVVFLICTGIQLFGMVIFLVFAKGEQQEWSIRSTNKTSKKNGEKTKLLE
ncbi:sialin-like [Antedon mediterranea]|uniref:sialin-like n=1 Tax=Antedon mediterranea TaxID=105859 RepID=UPI003AF6C9C0